MKEGLASGPASSMTPLFRTGRRSFPLDRTLRPARTALPVARPRFTPVIKGTTTDGARYGDMEAVREGWYG